METILNQVIEIIRQILDDKKISPNLHTKIIDLKGWGSLNHILLVSSIEEHFQIKFSFKEMLKWETIQDLVQIIEKKSALADSL